MQIKTNNPHPMDWAIKSARCLAQMQQSHGLPSTTNGSLVPQFLQNTSLILFGFPHLWQKVIRVQ